MNKNEQNNEQKSVYKSTAKFITQTYSQYAKQMKRFAYDVKHPAKWPDCISKNKCKPPYLYDVSLEVCEHCV